MMNTKLKQLNFSKNSENSEEREILKTHASNVCIKDKLSKSTLT